MKILRPTYAEINLKNLVYNINILKKFICNNINPVNKLHHLNSLNNNRTKPIFTHQSLPSTNSTSFSNGINILAVIKADAYGHGAIMIARAMESTPVKIFGVATIEEGIALREAGIKKNILILGSTFPFTNFKEIIKYNLIPTIASFSGLKTLNKYAVKANKIIPFHLKIDTGMGRIGLNPNTVISTLYKCSNFTNIFMEGIYSHIACANENRSFTEKQISVFQNISNTIRVNYAHISASTSILKYQNSHFNLIRPGLLIYGLLPFSDSDKILPTKPVLALKSKIIFLKTLPKNTSISYCRTFITKKRSKIATIPIGYADGFSRYNSNNSEVIIKGEKVPVVGRVCMDMTMIDVTNIKNVSVGDDVIIIGSQGKESITAEDIAKRGETINYEVVTSISKRIHRLYI